MRVARLAAALAAIVLAGCATQKPSDEEHAAHHSQAGPLAAKASQQMKTMQGMHQKMMAAKTPEERQALMAEHMKTMQDGMAMMGQMKGGQGGNAMGGGMSMGPEMMGKRMDMMEMMMQMMMDREAARSAPMK